MRYLQLLLVIIVFTACSSSNRPIQYRNKIADMPEFPASSLVKVKYKTYPDTVIFCANIGVDAKYKSVFEQKWMSNLSISVVDASGQKLWECKGIDSIKTTAGLARPLSTCSHGYDEAIHHVKGGAIYTITVSIDEPPTSPCSVPFALYAYEYRQLSLKERWKEGIMGNDKGITLIVNTNDLPSKK
jgi:hypothetical protein